MPVNAERFYRQLPGFRDKGLKDSPVLCVYRRQVLLCRIAAPHRHGGCLGAQEAGNRSLAGRISRAAAAAVDSSAGLSNCVKALYL